MVAITSDACSLTNDYSKAFDTVNHTLLIEELSSLGLPRPIFLLIANFLEGCTQTVKIGDLLSAYLEITRSIVQWSGLGPYLYIALVRRMKTISILNLWYSVWVDELYQQCMHE